MNPSKITTNKGIFIAFLFVLMTLAISLYFYAALPQPMITHWGIRGEANGFMPKEIGLSIVPVLMIILVAILYFIPKLDPLKKNIEEFQNDYQNFIAMFAGFMLYIQILSIIINLGIKINMPQWLSPALAILFYSLGVLLSKAKRNYFIGIRTPWTLNSETVWNKTHTLGGKLFKAAGLITLLGIFFPKQAIILLIGPIILVAAYLFVYSYLEYAKEKNK